MLTTICKTSVVSVYFFIIIYSSDYISFYLKCGGGNKDSGCRLSTTKIPVPTYSLVPVGWTSIVWGVAGRGSGVTLRKAAQR